MEYNLLYESGRGLSTVSALSRVWQPRNVLFFLSDWNCNK